MKKYFLAATVLILTGCSSVGSMMTNNYAVCMQTQEKISKDMVVMEAARVQAVMEMTKSSDPNVRSAALLLLQKNDVKSISLDCPR